MGMIASERVFKVLDNEDVTVDEGTLSTGNTAKAILHLKMFGLLIWKNNMY